MLRQPRWLRGAARRRSEAEQQRVGLLDIARALLTDDDVETERVAAALARQRQQAAREAAEQAEERRARERLEASAKWIRAECERGLGWFPEDWRRW